MTYIGYKGKCKNCGEVELLVEDLCEECNKK